MLFDRRWGTTGKIEMRLLPNEVKGKITRDETVWRERCCKCILTNKMIQQA